MTYHTIIAQEREISGYLKEWANSYYSKWIDYYHEAQQNKQSMRRQLIGADSILDLHNTLIGNIEGHFDLDKGQHLIPSKFASLDQVMGWLGWMKTHIQKHLPLIEENYKKVGAIYDVTNTHQMMCEYISVIDRCQKIYSLDADIPIPYQKLRSLLINNEIDAFVEQLKSVLSTIPYSIRKEAYNESYYHISVHSVLTILGFFPLSEDTTEKGRIDMAIRLADRTFIFEFKYSKKKSQATKALDQIKETGYADKYKLNSTLIIGVGIGFTESERNIASHSHEILYDNTSTYSKKD